MHIVLDLRMVGPHLHGIARYALELARRIPLLDQHCQFDLLVNKGFNSSLIESPPANIRFIPTKSRFLSPSEQIELPLLLRKLKPDLYHSPSFSVPVAYRGPLALTIHDANHLAFPKHYGHLHGLYYRQVVYPGASRARLLLTVSNFAKNEIEKRLNLSPGKIKVVYNGVNSSFRPFSPQEIESFRRSRKLPEQFILYVGNTKYHKNIIQLLNAFQLLPSNYSLVLCAGNQASKLVKKLGLAANRILVLDSANDHELPLLYACSQVFVFPSLYEGFGLPPLEAMACGVPVIATRATALPEVLQDAAAFVEPGDNRGLADTILRLDQKPEWVKQLRRAGLQRAAHFRWEKTAQSIFEAYRQAIFLSHAPKVINSLPNHIPGPRGPRLKILFCVRRDLSVLSGGDATQILRTKEVLEEYGINITLWSEPHSPNSGSYDLAHLFHIARLDTYVQAQSLTFNQLPFVLSSIYWPTSEFERQGYVGALRLLHSSLSTGPADIAKNGIRAILARGDWRWAMLPGFFLSLEQRIRFMVKNACYLLPNSEAEGDILRAFGATRIQPIVNAADPPPKHISPPGSLPKNFVLCAGRIEPRKNQLALVEALRDFELPLILVGDIGPMHRNYFSRVKKAAGRNTTFLPAIPREQLFAYYQAAQAHIAPAWYETPGLVSLEAAAAGTRVVTTDRGSTREYFLEEAYYLDPGNSASIRNALQQALSSPKPKHLQQRVLQEFTWEKAGAQTLEVYRKVLDERNHQHAA